MATTTSTTTETATATPSDERVAQAAWDLAQLVHKHGAQAMLLALAAGMDEVATAYRGGVLEDAGVLTRCKAAFFAERSKEIASLARHSVFAGPDGEHLAGGLEVWSEMAS